MVGMNADQVAALRELLGPSDWMERTQQFARALRVSTRSPGGLLLVGGYFTYRYFSMYETTDDAEVDGHLMPLSARISKQIGNCSAS